MLHTYQLKDLRSRLQSATLMTIAAVVAVAGLVPLTFQGSASAAVLSNRSVAITNSAPSATGVTYNFTFTAVTNAAIQSMTFEFCDDPLAACVLPGDAISGEMDVSHATASAGAFTGTNATAFADYTTNDDPGGCTSGSGGSQVAEMLCVTRTQAAAEAPGIKTFAITGITNPNIETGNNEPIYVRITTYSDTAFATPVDDGVVAAAVVNQLTVTGRVQERLVFCVFALSDAAGSGAVGSGNGNFPTDCSANEAVASSSVDIGTIDNLSIAQSPVDNSPPTSNGNDRFGAAIVNTNASNGVTLTYYASQATSGTGELRSFRVPGADCTAADPDDANSATNQCFISADDSAGEGFVAGTERFGMQIACIDNNLSTGTINPGTTGNLGSGGTGSGTSGGTFNTIYSNTDDDIDDSDDDCENSDAGVKFAWRDSGTAQALVHSTSVVDDELVKLRFGATAAATTPTGSYTVATTFIATPVF